MNRVLALTRLLRDDPLVAPGRAAMHQSVRRLIVEVPAADSRLPNPRSASKADIETDLRTATESPSIRLLIAQGGHQSPIVLAPERVSPRRLGFFVAAAQPV